MKRVCGMEDVLKDTDRALEGFVGDEGYGGVKLAACSLSPDYPVAPRTHFRRSSSATCS